MATTFAYEIRAQKKDGTYPVYIRVTHNRKLKRLSTNIYVEQKDLKKNGDLKNQAVIDKLQDIMRDFRKKCSNLSFALNSMSIDEVVDYLIGKDIEHFDFIKVYRDFIAENKDKLKGIKNYVSALNSLLRFIGRDELFPSEITYKFLSKYENFIGSGTRAASLYLGSLRHVYSWAQLQYNNEERGIIPFPYSPFQRFKIQKQEEVKQRAISIGDIVKIMSLPYDEAKNSRYNLAKDCFMLSFFLMGMNSADLYEATTFEKGKIKYERTKTRGRRRDRALIHVVVPERVQSLFEKHRDKTGKRVFDFYNRFSNYHDLNRSINIGLKEVGAAIGVPDLTYYAARHSWATIARNDLGIDRGTVDEALNHIDASHSLLDIYVKKDFVQINLANQKVVDYLFEKYDALSLQGDSGSH
jgi:integrase